MIDDPYELHRPGLSRKLKHPRSRKRGGGGWKALGSPFNQNPRARRHEMEFKLIFALKDIRLDRELNEGGWLTLRLRAKAKAGRLRVKRGPLRRRRMSGTYRNS
jgi:hypothetical protein